MTALSLTGRDVFVDLSAIPAKGWDFFYSECKRLGIAGAIRYIHSGSAAKRVTAAERVAAAKYGRRVILVDELNTQDGWAAANDYQSGRDRATGAIADAAAKGFPRNTACTPAADAHATAAQVAQAAQYCRGFADVYGKALSGMYGFMEVLTACRPYATWFWVAGSKPSKEDARWLAFWQDNTGYITVAGVQCDRNWRLDGPLPGATEEEDEMSAEAEHRIDSYLDAKVSEVLTTAKHAVAIETENQVRINGLNDSITALKTALTALATQVSKLSVSGGSTGISDADVARIVKAQNDDEARRMTQ